MSKLYVFAIGGTGARVLKSLTFLLASGVDFNGYTLVPILIDPDESNGDLNKAFRLLNEYRDIRDQLRFNNENKNRFFKTPIEEVSNEFRLRIPNTDKKFKNFIGLSNIDNANRALTSLLFSQSNLDAEMDVGFKGNPNMGSVVLNQFTSSEDFHSFANSFSAGDRIFIVSSIFGGTGASGFPLMLKNLRSGDQSVPNSALLQKAPVGALSMLPYFGVKKDENSAIDKSTFVSKARAALRYYEKNVTNADLQRMYYLGDKVVKDYENHEGSSAQVNDAHFLELAAALAIADFAETTDQLMNTPQVKEFGINNGDGTVHFTNLGTHTYSTLFEPLTQFFYLRVFLDKKIRETLDQAYAQDLGLDKNTLSDSFFRLLYSFTDQYWSWLKEMQNNKCSFSPFDLSGYNSKISELLNDKKPKRRGMLSMARPKDFERLIQLLNKQSNDQKKVKGSQGFFNLFYEASRSYIKETFN